MGEERQLIDLVLSIDHFINTPESGGSKLSVVDILECVQNNDFDLLHMAMESAASFRVSDDAVEELNGIEHKLRVYLYQAQASNKKHGGS